MRGTVFRTVRGGRARRSGRRAGTRSLHRRGCNRTTSDAPSEDVAGFDVGEAHGEEDDAYGEYEDVHLRNPFLKSSRQAGRWVDARRDDASGAGVVGRAVDVRGNLGQNRIKVRESGALKEIGIS
ncbi:protein of unknown function [Aminobacter niigataensis]|nr:protein of unknown function [Aminobacter niigataensis]